jgi:hypothetical protein
MIQASTNMTTAAQPRESSIATIIDPCFNPHLQQRGFMNRDLQYETPGVRRTSQQEQEQPQHTEVHQMTLGAKPRSRPKKGIGRT